MISEVLEEHTIDPEAFKRIRILPDFYYSLKLNKDLIINYFFDYAPNEYSLCIEVDNDVPVYSKYIFEDVNELKSLLISAVINTKPVNLKNTSIFKKIKDTLFWNHKIKDLFLIDVKTTSFKGLGVMLSKKTNEVVFFNKALSFHKEINAPQFIDKIAYKSYSGEISEYNYYFYDESRNRLLEFNNNRIQLSDSEVPIDLKELNRNVQYMDFLETKQYLFDHCVIDMKRETEKQEIVNQFANIDLF